MVASLAVALLLGQQIQLPQGADGREMVLTSADQGTALLMLQARLKRLEAPKKSPLNAWEFEYLTAGYTRETENENYNIRIRVFNQFRPSEKDPTDFAARVLLRLWDFNRWRLWSDHQLRLHMRTVDVYLCFGGSPGAEQKFLEDPFQADVSGNAPFVSNIYVYAVPSLTDRLEFLRELAHEYGHATWPPLGGYTKPEQWANGDMGERVFLMWLLKEVEAGRLTPADTMEVALHDLRSYYRSRVLPDLKRVAMKGPDLEVLKQNDEKSYAELLGLTSYLAAVMPYRMFGRVLFLNATGTAEGLHKSALEAAMEKEEWTVQVPDGLAGEAIWVPMAKGSVKGAKELQRRGDWVKIQPTAKDVVVLNED